jgi:hypothetical protein
MVKVCRPDLVTVLDLLHLRSRAHRSASPSPTHAGRSGRFQGHLCEWSVGKRVAVIVARKDTAHEIRTATEKPSMQPWAAALTASLDLGPALADPCRREVHPPRGSARLWRTLPRRHRKGPTGGRGSLCDINGEVVNAVTSLHVGNSLGWDISRCFYERTLNMRTAHCGLRKSRFYRRKSLHNVR